MSLERFSFQPSGLLVVGLAALGMWAIDAAISRRNPALTAEERNALPESDFALPGRHYPIDTPERARSALARVEANGNVEEIHQVRESVKRRYPEMEVRENPQNTTVEGTGLSYKRMNSGILGTEYAVFDRDGHRISKIEGDYNHYRYRFGSGRKVRIGVARSIEDAVRRVAEMEVRS